MSGRLFRASRRSLVVLALAAMSLIAVSLVRGVPASAQIVGAPVTIDNFAGTTVGTRTVTVLPTGDSTTSPGTFSESGGIATMTMNGSGNTQGGVELDYTPSSPVDLTGGGTDTQFFLEAPEILRSDYGPPDNYSALDVTISVTDSNGVTGVYNDGIGNAFAFNLVLNFNCAVPSEPCFEPQPDFTSVTNVEILFQYPQNYDSANGVTTVQLSDIVTTPTGGEIPDPPSPSFNATSPQITAVGGTVNFPVTFTSDGAPDAVSNDPPSATGLLATGVQVTTTSSDALTATVTGGPSSYNIAVTGMTTDQDITVTVLAGAVADAWGNDNLAGSATVQFTLGVPPSFTGTAAGSLTVGTDGTATVTATGSPAPTLTSSGQVPIGVTFSTSTSGDVTTGTFSGDAVSFSGAEYTPSVTASNGFSPDATETYDLTVDEAPTFLTLGSDTFVAGLYNSFTPTTAGYPVPTMAESGALPTGVSVDPDTGALTGTPVAGSGGAYPLTFTASNSVTTIEQSFTLTVDEVPVFTSADATTFTVGDDGSFTVGASGYPASGVSESGALPEGVSFDAATGLLSGTPAVGSGGTYYPTFYASNDVGTPVSQAFTLTVDEGPTISSADSATFTAGSFGSAVVTSSGTPAPTVSESGALPDGVTFDPTTDTLSGTPAAGTGGSYPLTFTASNGIGTDASQEFTLLVDEAPTISSQSSASFTVGSLGTFTVTGTGYPAPTLTEQGVLPSGVTFDPATGTLSGTPAAGSEGVYAATLTADNGVGTAAEQDFTLDVVAATTVEFILPARTLPYGHAVWVRVNAPGETPTGSVTVYDGGAEIATVALNAESQIRVPQTFLDVGVHSLTATFVSDSPLIAGGSTAAPVRLRVTRAETSTLLSTPENPARARATIHLTARVVPQFSEGVPTGTVSFIASGIGAPLCTVHLHGKSATCLVSAQSLGAGTFQIVAVYRGDRNDVTSTSPTLSEKVE